MVYVSKEESKMEEYGTWKWVAEHKTERSYFWEHAGSDGTGSGARLQTFTAFPQCHTSSNKASPPKLPQLVPSTGNQVFIYPSL